MNPAVRYSCHNCSHVVDGGAGEGEGADSKCGWHMCEPTLAFNSRPSHSVASLKILDIPESFKFQVDYLESISFWQEKGETRDNPKWLNAKWTDIFP